MKDKPKTPDVQQDLVITPGGPRRRENVQQIEPGQVVRLDEEGTLTILPKQEARTRTGRPASEDWVMTPGGPHLRSLVHEVPNDHVVRIADGKWSIADPSGKVVKELAARAFPPSGPTLGFGWITNSVWNNNTGKNISSFTTTWVVPPVPRTASGQLVYLFNGVQVNIVSNNPQRAGIHILQPVLQWGTGSPDNSGDYWVIASWFAGNLTQPAIFTNPINVNPGQTLTGLITLTGSSGNLFNYTCQFVGFPGSVLNVQIPAPFQCVETLEAYAIVQATDYPNTLRTAMGAIGVQTGGSNANISWSAVNRVTDCTRGRIHRARASDLIQSARCAFCGHHRSDRGDVGHQRGDMAGTGPIDGSSGGPSGRVRLFSTPGFHEPVGRVVCG